VANRMRADVACPSGNKNGRIFHVMPEAKPLSRCAASTDDCKSVR
jgi:hypothetical protein